MAKHIQSLTNKIDAVEELILGLLDNSRIRQLADCQLSDWTTRGLDISCHVDWSTRGLDNLRTGQVADWTTHGCHRRLCVLKAKFHYASWFGASSELAPNMFRASSELASEWNLAANLLSSC